MAAWLTKLTMTVKICIFVAIGLSFALCGILSYLCVPSLIEYIVKQKLILSSPAAETYDSWHRTPVPIYVKFYFFNVTNPDEVLSLKGPPIVEEIGPYAFREHREKVNVTWDHTNGTIAYEQVRRWNYIPEMTGGSLSDRITHLNVPMVSAGNNVRLNEDYVFSDVINGIANASAAYLFPTHNVSSLLFEGYQDDFLDAGKTLNYFVPYDKFGWFYGKNNTASDGVYSIFTGESGIEKFGFMNSWNGMEKLHFYEGYECNRLDRSTPGDFRPPFTRPKPTVIYIFVGDLCRTIPLHFLKETKFKGIKVDRYWADNKIFDYSYEENKCYCPHRRCPKNGVFNTSLCQYGSPSAISFPHFLFADSVYSTRVRGLNPDPEEHAFFVDIEPLLGVAVRVAARMQVNIVFERIENVDHAANLTHDSVYYPMFWTSSTAEIGDEMVDRLLLLQNKLPNYITIGAFCLISVACVILLATLVYALKSKKKCEKSARNTNVRYQYKVVSTSFNH